MEAATRVQSATLKRAHRSLGKELKLIADLFGKYLPEIPYPFPVRGGTKAIMRDDFDNNIDVIPVSDPNISSSAQRMMRAEALLRFATQAPELHNTQEAFRQMYIEMGIDPQRVELLLPNKQAQQPVPMDPLSENQTAMMGGPLKAGEYQDHDAHIAAHAPIAEQNPNLQAHINEHMALKMRMQVQQMIGQPLPPPGTPMPPEMENQLAMMVAQAMQQLAPQYKQQPEPDPLVQIEAQKVQQKAVSDQVKADVELQKAQIAAQSESADRETKKTIAAMRIAADLKTHDQGSFGG
jgi:hypothetical protein